MEKTIAVLGGDRRMALLARLLAEDGHPVRTWGLAAFGMEDTALEEAAQADRVVLPVPLSRGKNLNCTATALPLVPSYVCGIFNMRGQIIPVLNIRRRLGKSDNEGENLLIVLNYDNMQIGVLVDAVDQMVEIDDESILPMPAQSMQRFVSGMCTIPDGSGTMLVLDCVRYLNPELENRPQEPQDTLCSRNFIIEDFFNMNYQQDIRIEDLAERLSLSTKQTTRILQELCGQTFRKKLTQTRVQMSKSLLRHTDMPVASIAENVGFQTANGFVEAFRSEAGMTPSQFRKK